MDQDRFRIYVSAQRKARGFQRAADYVFLAIVILALAGSAVGLFPELEKSRQLDQRIVLETERVEIANGFLRQKQLRLQHLQHDVDYMEQELRSSSRRSAKPGETLILLPPVRRKVYEGENGR
ncbi:MAG: hypothetical protein ACI8T1_003395 [Verrucomicrobiales bacterium]